MRYNNSRIKTKRLRVHPLKAIQYKIYIAHRARSVLGVSQLAKMMEKLRNREKEGERLWICKQKIVQMMYT